MKRLLIVMAVAALAAGAASPAAARQRSNERPIQFSDNIESVMSQRQDELRQAAREAVINGDAKAVGSNQLVALHGGHRDHRGHFNPFRTRYVELGFEGEDQILTLLGEFGTQQAGPAEHPGHPAHGGTPGPLHNEIPQPDRAVDNSTLWSSDFNQAHYTKLLFSKNTYPSMANYYLDASSGKYSVTGYVSDWVQVPFNAAAYGSNYCGSIVCTRDIGRFIEAQADTWWTTLVAEQGSVAAANAFLSQFDVWDRYDFDGDGDFDEPDGYIDHFQSVHAGEGEETGGGAQGTDAIWSHRTYVNSVPIGADGPPGGPAFGGAQIGASDYWIGDYTIEPENGGVGVFAHEFGHDLGLPDEYDTSGNTGGAENSTGWWTTWSQGSYGTINNEGIGNYPVSMTAWERYQLGFYDPDNIKVVDSDDHVLTTLGPAEYNNRKNQFIIINLPDKEVTADVGNPAVGPTFYYSGSNDLMDTSMTAAVNLPAGASLSAQVKYNIEIDFDYAYVTVDGVPIPTNLSAENGNPNGNDFGHGITGVQSGYTTLTADLSAYTGSHVVGFEYITDPAQQGDPSSDDLPGIAIDDITISGQAADLGGWTFDSTSANAGFHETNGTDTNFYDNAYFLENRTFATYDKSLKYGPYNFGFPTAPNKVEHFSNQDGLLVWYWNSQYSDNNVGDHPGEGEILPVDAHPNINKWADGTQMRPRINSYDSTFGLERTQSITLHNPADGVATRIRSQWGNPLFDDTKSYWVSGDPSDAAGDGRYQAEWNSVKLPAVGVKVRVLFNRGDWMVLKIN